MFVCVLSWGLRSRSIAFAVCSLGPERGLLPLPPGALAIISEWWQQRGRQRWSSCWVWQCRHCGSRLSPCETGQCLGVSHTEISIRALPFLDPADQLYESSRICKRVSATPYSGAAAAATSVLIPMQGAHWEHWPVSRGTVFSTSVAATLSCSLLNGRAYIVCRAVSVKALAIPAPVTLYIWTIVVPAPYVAALEAVWAHVAAAHRPGWRQHHGQGGQGRCRRHDWQCDRRLDSVMLVWQVVMRHTWRQLRATAFTRPPAAGRWAPGCATRAAPHRLKKGLLLWCTLLPRCHSCCITFPALFQSSMLALGKHVPRHTLLFCLLLMQW